MKANRWLGCFSLVGLMACSGAAPEQPAVGAAPAAAASAGEGRAAVGAPPRAPAAPDPTIEQRAEILRLIGLASCRDDSQCRALPVGSKPCGGPETYLAWSVAATQVGQLEALAGRYKEARAARNQRLGMMSDCAVVPEPAVRCVPDAAPAQGGRCQALPARPGAAPPR